MQPITAWMMNVDAVTAKISPFVSSRFEDAASDSLSVYFFDSVTLSTAFTGGTNPINPIIATAFANTLKLPSEMYWHVLIFQKVVHQ